MTEFLVQCQQDCFVDALNYAIGLVEPESLMQVNGFMVQGGQHRSGGGQAVLFWSNAPDQALADLVVNLENYPAMCVDRTDSLRVFLRFHSEHFLFNNPSLFMADFSAALSVWDSKQVKLRRMVIRSRQISKIVCNTEDGVSFSAMIEYNLNKMSTVVLHSSSLEW